MTGSKPRSTKSRVLLAGANVLALLVVGIALWSGVLACGGVGAQAPAEATPTYPPPTPPIRPNPTIGASADCTIEKMAARYEIALSSVDRGTAADRSRATADLAARFPVATVEDQTVATVATKTFPDIDDRTVLVYLLSGDTGPVGGGPVGHPPLGPVRDMCTLVFYEAETEAFISTVRHVTF